LHIFVDSKYNKSCPFEQNYPNHQNRPKIRNDEAGEVPATGTLLIPYQIANSVSNPIENHYPLNNVKVKNFDKAYAL